jgi:hypothetical protein
MLLEKREKNNLFILFLSFFQNQTSTVTLIKILEMETSVHDSLQAALTTCAIKL